MPQVQSAVVGKYDEEDDYYVNIAYKDGGCSIYDDICETRTTWWILNTTPEKDRMIATDTRGVYA